MGLRTIEVAVSFRRNLNPTSIHTVDQPGIICHLVSQDRVLCATHQRHCHWRGQCDLGPHEIDPFAVPHRDCNQYSMLHYASSGAVCQPHYQPHGAEFADGLHPGLCPRALAFPPRIMLRPPSNSEAQKQRCLWHGRTEAWINTKIHRQY